MDFITWWFDTHYILSTIFSPFYTWLWLLYTDGNIWREIACWMLPVLTGVIKAFSK